MSIIKILNPFNCCPAIKTVGLKREFSKLTPLHKSITVVACSIFTLLTLGLGTRPYLRKLVGRFRKIELDTKSRMAKVPRAASQILSPPKAATPPQPNKQNPVVADDQLVEKEFLESHLQNDNLHRFLEMAAINSNKDHQKTATSVVDHYLKFKQAQSAIFTLTPAQQDLLVKLVMAQLKANEHPVHPPSEKGKVISHHRLKDGRQLVTHQTGSDGSCALHALLGVPVSGVYKTDAAGRRKALCEWLDMQYKKYQLHERACNILQDYFDHFKNAPETFRAAVRKKHQQYRKNFDKLGNSPQDLMKRGDIKAAFIYDPVVFRAYCDELMNVSRYMLQEELIMAAECFGYQLELHQPDWNDRAGKGGNRRHVVSDTFNTSAPGKKIHIWYNGLNHYERADINK